MSYEGYLFVRLLNAPSINRNPQDSLQIMTRGENDAHAFCVSPINGWTPINDGNYEMAPRTSMFTDQFQDIIFLNCQLVVDRSLRKRDHVSRKQLR